MFNQALMLQELNRDEANKLRAYKDTKGFWTIAVGVLIDPAAGAKIPPEVKMPNGVLDTCCTITQAQSDALTLARLTSTWHELVARLPWVASLDEVRACAVLNMAYNMGVPHLMAFTQTLGAIQKGAWQLAHDNIMANHIWPSQVGWPRVTRIANQILTGIAQ